MEKHNFTKYYRVYKNGTTITEVSANDFIPLKLKGTEAGWITLPPVDVLCSIPAQPYSLPVGNAMYYGYTSKIKAMEKAKAGSLAYLELMIKNVEDAITKLKQYRYDHYTDLNINLLDANIRRLENEINSK